MVSWFGPQNQAGDGLSIAPKDRWEEDGVRHASRSSDLLCLKASHDHRGDHVEMKLKMDGSM
jgi:hypothetical protein